MNAEYKIRRYFSGAAELLNY